MRKIIHIICLYGTLLYIGTTSATLSNGNLYTAHVSIPDQTPAERKIGFQGALKQVLIKLSGNQHVVEQNNLLDLLQKAEIYVLQYKYEKPATTDTNMTTDAFILSVQFDADTLDKVLQNRGISIWDARPDVLIWLAVDDQNGQRVVQLTENYLSQTEYYARTRGIRLFLPLLDLKDKAALTVSDIRAKFSNQIIKASKRYPTDDILYGYIEEKTATQWQGQWTAIIKGQALHFQETGQTTDQMLKKSINKFADYLALHYASPLHSNVTTFFITVHGVNSLASYAKILHYLENLRSVRQIFVTNLQEDRVKLKLTSSGGIKGIAENINLDRVFKPLPNGNGTQFQLQRH